MCRDNFTRLQQRVSVSSMVLTLPTIILVFHIVNWKQIQDLRGVFVYVCPAIWLILSVGIIAAFRKESCGCCLLACFSMFYFLQIISYVESYSILLNEDDPSTIDYIEDPLNLLLLSVILSLITLYCTLLILVVIACWCLSEYHPDSPFYIISQLIILTLAGFVTYQLVIIVYSDVPLNLKLVFAFMLGTVIAVQLFMVLFKDSYKNAMKGLFDSFYWTYIPLFQKLMLFAISGFSIFVFVFIFIVSQETKYHNLKVNYHKYQNNYTPQYLMAIYIVVSANLLSGFLGFLIARLIRMCLRRCRRPLEENQFIVLIDENQENQEIYGYVKTAKYERTKQHNVICPICLNEFINDQLVAVHQLCQNGFHIPCIRGWVEHGKNGCPLCRQQLN